MIRDTRAGPTGNYLPAMPRRIPKLDTRKPRPSTGARIRPTTAERGYGARWRRTRAVKLSATPLCEDCDERGVTMPASEVDHIDGKGPNGPAGHDVLNLRSLCKSCHSRKTVMCDGGFGHHKRE